MTETYEFLIIIFSSILWRLGGWKWKGFRRYLLPLAMLLFGWKVVGFTPNLVWACLMSCLIYHFGYGEEHKDWERIVIAIGYGAATLPLGFTIWQMIVPIVWLSLWWLSNSRLRNSFGWGLVEILFGTVLGCMWRNLL